MTGARDTALGEGFLRDLDDRLTGVDERVARQYPGDSGSRQPVHTVYVPASTYDADLVRTWGARAALALAEYGHPDVLSDVLEFGVPHDLYRRVVTKLDREPIEDLRIDFEDGYGRPGDRAEDADAVRTAAALAGSLSLGAAPPFVGIRCKGLDRDSRRRGIRTLDLFLAELVEHVPLPDGFVVTLPKVVAVDQVAAFVEVLRALEQAHGLPDDRLRFEVQIETPQAVFAADGTVAVAGILAAAGGRCAGLHFGTYDYSAAVGVPAGDQSLAHPAADFAKSVMQVAAAGTGVRLSDGSTNLLPVGEVPAVRAAWREHARLVRRSLGRAFFQGWDLHPHQLPTRFLATYSFFREGLAASAERLRAYLDGAQSGTFDEPATARALAGFLVRGVDCGALDDAEVTAAAGLDRRVLDRLAGRGPAMADGPAPDPRARRT